jgi:CubicO group peptidase (beta-lactamase class C family)
MKGGNEGPLAALATVRLRSRVAISRRTFLARAAACAAGAAAAPAGPVAQAAELGTEDLSAFVRRQMVTGRVPGLAACVVRDGRVAWSRGWGSANLFHDRRATPDTVFMLASISKTVMAVAAMQAVEDGLVELDADVNDVLPFPVRNPNHPDDPITLRMLLTHSSSIRDAWAAITPFYVRGDSPIALGDYLRRYLTPDGDLFRPLHTFGSWRPGGRYEYCNIAASLAGFAVEAASVSDFDTWCERRIFGPLGMTETSWHLAELDRTLVAMAYGYRGGRFEPYGLYGYPDYPDGQLRTSARHLAHHLLAFMEFGRLDGVRILQEETVREMRRSQIPDLVDGQGLIWYAFRRAGRRLIGHNGGDWGVATQMYFRPDDGVGVVVLANGNWHWTGSRYPLASVTDRLFTEADRLGTSRSLEQEPLDPGADAGLVEPVGPVEVGDRAVVALDPVGNADPAESPRTIR